MRASHSAIVDRLRKISPFVFYANSGNLGDQLIAVATRQLFRKHHIEFIEYDGRNLPCSYHLVYGGGGGLVPYWGALPRLQQILLDKRIISCVILPHSIHGADELVASLDARHVVYCREEHTYEYCSQLNNRASFYQADDMALSYELDSCNMDKRFAIPCKLSRLAYYAASKFLGRCTQKHGQIQSRKMWNQGLRDTMQRLVRQSCYSVHVGGIEKKAALLLRQDAERARPEYSSYACGDLSRLWEGNCNDDEFGQLLVHAFMEALNIPDIVITDRLHVGIAAHLQKKEVYWLDNSYRKISGIYNYSLKDEPNIHLVSSLDELAQLTPSPNTACTYPISHQKKSIIARLINKLYEI